MSNITPQQAIQGMSPGMTPVDFIMNNLSRNNPPAATAPASPPPAAPVATTLPTDTPSFVSAESDFNLPLDTNSIIGQLPPPGTKPYDMTKPPETINASTGEVMSTPPTPPAAPTPETVTDVNTESPQTAEELLELVKEDPKTKGPRESIRHFKEQTKTLKTELDAKEVALKEAQEKLTKYETGELLPEVVKQKDEKITELTYYQKLHAFKTSEEYVETYIKPMDELNEKALAIATDYNVSVDVLNHALELDNKKERNAFLKDHFDDVGAYEAIKLLDDIKDLHVKRVEAEKAPEQNLAKIQTAIKNKEAVSQQQRVSSLTNASRDGWIEALTSVQADERYPALRLTGNSEHDDKFIKPVRAAAAKEFGEFIKFLAAKGVGELSKEEAQYLGTTFLLAKGHNLSAASAASHYSEKEQLLRETQRIQPLLRPAVGGSITSVAPAPSRPKSNNEAAQMILSSVISKG